MTGKRLALLYATWALPLLLALAWIVPPWTITDEPFHMLRAVGLAHGHLLGERFDNPDKTGPKGSGGLSDNAIFEAFTGFAKMSWLPNQPNGQVTRVLLDKSNAVKWHHETDLAWFGSTVRYPPCFYLPDIAGYWIGRAAGMHVNATLRLARCLNALLFLAMAATAIARAPRLSLLLTTLLMLPMTLALAASANQDAGIIATMALVVAQFDRIAAESRPARRWELTTLAAGLGCVAAARPPYIALLPILLVAAPGRRGRIVAAGAAGAVAIWSALVAIFVMRPQNGVSPAAKTLLLLAHPASIFYIVFNTLRDYTGAYAWQFIGFLGWNDTALPLAFTAFAYMALALAAAASMTGPAFGRRVVPACVLAGTVAMFAVQYLDWTKLGADHVEGVVGRYFLPPALALTLALPAWRHATRLATPAYIALALLATATPAIMLHHIVMHFYVAQT